jgi:uncharacterized integral membrane protein
VSTDQPLDPSHADAEPTPAGPSTGSASGPGSGPASEPEADASRPSGTRLAPDPLRGSRTSGTWIAVLALALLLVLLAVFILQNTQAVEVSFLGWSGRAPLSATLLIAAAGGALVVASAGVLRILQLRRRVKRQRMA